MSTSQEASQSIIQDVTQLVAQCELNSLSMASTSENNTSNEDETSISFTVGDKAATSPNVKTEGISATVSIPNVFNIDTFRKQQDRLPKKTSARRRRRIEVKEGATPTENSNLPDSKSAKSTRLKLGGKIESGLISNWNQVVASFEQMDLNPNLLRGISAYGLKNPKEIQQLAIVPCINGRDVIVEAQFGSGKTVAYCISVLNGIDRENCVCQALILASTKELAQDIYKIVVALSEYMKISCHLCIGGGTRVREEKSILASGIQIVIGTPGRVIDMICRGGLKTDTIRTFVLGNAVELSSPDFSENIHKIFKTLNEKRQVVIMSTTMPRKQLEFIFSLVHDPITIHLEPEERHLFQGMKPFYVSVKNEESKLGILWKIIESLSTTTQTVVFCNTRRKVDRLTTIMKEKKDTVSSLHGNTNLRERQEIIRSNYTDSSQLLIKTHSCTGNLKQCSLFINYDLPTTTNKEFYLPRAECDGQFGFKAVVINLVTDVDQQLLTEIKALCKTEIVRIDLENILSTIENNTPNEDETSVSFMIGDKAATSPNVKTEGINATVSIPNVFNIDTFRKQQDRLPKKTSARHRRRIEVEEGATPIENSNLPDSRSAKSTRLKLGGKIESGLISNWNQVVASFEQMDLNPNLLRGISAYGLKNPKEIQQLAIVPCINGRDVIVEAQFGSGKTVAYSISVLNGIDRENRVCQALILASTKELAQNIYKIVVALSEYMKISCHLCIGGGTRVREEQSILASGIQIVIGTPGRVIDMICRGGLKTDTIRTFVLENVVEISSTDFREEIHKIFKTLNEKRQVVIMSTMMPRKQMGFIYSLVYNPIKIHLEPEERYLFEGMKPFYVSVQNEESKLVILLKIIESLFTTTQTVIFCNTRRNVDRLTNIMKEKKDAISSLHENTNLRERKEIIRNDYTGSSQLLIKTHSCTSDLKQYSLFINYDLPTTTNKQFYLPRAEGDGQFGCKDVVINLVTDEDQQLLKEIKALCKTEIVRIDVENILSSSFQLFKEPTQPTDN